MLGVGGLENRRLLTGLVSSNLTLSAIKHSRGTHQIEVPTMEMVAAPQKPRLRGDHRAICPRRTDRCMLAASHPGVATE